LAPALAAGIAIGATLLWQRRHDVRAATTMAASVLVTVILAAVLLSRHNEWLPWLRVAVGAAGVGAAVLLLVVGKLDRGATRFVAGLAVVSCLAGPLAFSLATAATPHTGAIPSVGPSGAGGHGGGFGGGGLLSSPTPHPDLIRLLSTDVHEFTWAAAVVGSNNAAGYQLAVGAPVMAIGGFNGTDPSPTLDEFIAMVDAGRIHYFILGPSMMMGHQNAGGAQQSSAIREWVEARFPELTIDGTVVYDLTQAPVISQQAHSSAPR
ncbi:glycosyl transferase, partial [Mycobacterium sp. ITM-2017-0098]